MYTHLKKDLYNFRSNLNYNFDKRILVDGIEMKVWQPLRLK